MNTTGPAGPREGGQWRRARDFTSPSSCSRPQRVDRHRAIVSIQEELEAVDWYDQRVEATTDESLAAVLAHNRDEEKEHAAMTIEWLRRKDPVLDGHLRTYLFTSEPITAVEAEAEGGSRAADLATVRWGSEVCGAESARRSAPGRRHLAAQHLSRSAPDEVST